MAILSDESKALLKKAADAIYEGSAIYEGMEPFSNLSYDDYLFLSQQIATIINGFLKSPELVQNTVLIAAVAAQTGIEGKQVFDVLQL